MTWARIWDVGALALVVLAVYILVRPTSKAGDLIQAWSTMIVSVVTAATNMGGNSQPSTTV